MIRLIFCLTFCFPFSCFSQYDSYLRNPDGTYVVGGMYDSYMRNPDGTYVVGGMYDSYMRNPDGTYVVSPKLFILPCRY